MPPWTVVAAAVGVASVAIVARSRTRI
jgi:hypothetical protein